MQALKSAGMKFREPPTAQEQDQKLRDVASLYEKQFLREMVKAMRSTVSESGLIPTNQGEKIFREQLDQQYADQWGDKGGIGLQNLIYDQLIDKYGVALGITKLDQIKGPIAFKPGATALPISEAQPRFKLNYELKAPLSDRDVLSPWSGTLIGKTKVDAKNTLLELKHDNGISSRLSFNGQAESFQPGEEIAAGQKVGSLDPQAQSVFWGLE